MVVPPGTDFGHVIDAPGQLVREVGVGCSAAAQLLTDFMGDHGHPQSQFLLARGTRTAKAAVSPKGRSFWRSACLLRHAFSDDRPVNSRGISPSIRLNLTLSIRSKLAFTPGAGRALIGTRTTTFVRSAGTCSTVDPALVQWSMRRPHHQPDAPLWTSRHSRQSSVGDTILPRSALSHLTRVDRRKHMTGLDASRVQSTGCKTIVSEFRRSSMTKDRAVHACVQQLPGELGSR